MPVRRRSASRSRATLAAALAHTALTPIALARPLAVVGVLVTAPALAACGPRQVAVRTGESPVAEATIEFTNNLPQAVNVYVRPNTGAGEIFLRQVPAQTTESIPVRGVAPGTAVRLRATPVSGNPNYEQDNVVLARGYVWRVP